MNEHLFSGLKAVDVHDAPNDRTPTRGQRRLTVASLALGVLAGAAAILALVEALGPVAGRSMSARDWQAVHAWPFAWAAVAYLAGSCAAHLLRARRPGQPQATGSWLAVGTHLLVVAAVGAALARGPASRVLFTGHDLLAAIVLVVAMLSSAIELLRIWSVRRNRSDDVAPAPLLGPSGRVAALGQVFASVLLAAVCAWTEQRALPGQGEIQSPSGVIQQTTMDDSPRIRG